MKKIFRFLTVVFFAAQLAQAGEAEWNEMNNKVVASYQSGDYGNAVRYAEQALAVARRAFSKEHENYSTSLNNLAFLYVTIGKYREAEPLYQEAMAIYKELEPKGRHPDYASSLNNLAFLYVTIGKYREAEPLYQEAMAIYKELEPKGRHPYYATSLNNLGLLYQTIGKYREAEPLYQEAMAIRKELEPKGRHPHYATSLNNLGLLYQTIGKYREAEPLYQEAMAIRKELEPKGRHPDYAGSLNNLAGLYDTMGKYREAEPLYQEAMAIRKELEPKGRHPDYAGSLNNLGLMYRTIGKYREAEPLYQEAMAIYKELEPKGRHPYYATSLNNLGLLYQTIGKYREAEPLYQEAMAIRKELEPKGRHPHYATSLNNLGSFCYEQGRYAEAKPLLEDAVAIYEFIRNGQIPDEAKKEYFATILYTYQWLILCHISMGEPEKAFDIKELSSAKYLVEKLGERAGLKAAASFSIENRRGKLPEDTLVISYANTEFGNDIAILTCSRTRTTGRRVSKTNFTSSMLNRYNTEISRVAQEGQRGIKLENPQGELALKSDSKAASDFASIITWYKSLLASPGSAVRGNADFDIVSRELYSLLIDSVKDQLAGRKRIIIIPDGVLGLLPFEVLQNTNGKYLVEQYELSYTQSLTVSGIIADRL